MFGCVAPRCYRPRPRLCDIRLRLSLCLTWGRRCGARHSPSCARIRSDMSLFLFCRSRTYRATVAALWARRQQDVPWATDKTSLRVNCHADAEVLPRRLIPANYRNQYADDRPKFQLPVPLGHPRTQCAPASGGLIMTSYDA